MVKPDDRDESVDGQLERAKDRALGAHDDNPSVADEVGEAAGGISGALLGAGVGSTAGPLGTVIGGIAGALGGWWTGRAVTEAASALSSSDEAYYREHYEASGGAADLDFTRARDAYYLGHIASQNPNFQARAFDEVEPELAAGWTRSGADRRASWDAVKDYAREGYARGERRIANGERRARGLGEDVERRP